MVNGRPELLRKSSPIFLYFSTPNRFIMLHGNSLNLVTPIDDTRTTLFTEEGNADTRFFTPIQSTLSGVLSSSQRLEGNAVVPVQQITCVTPSNIDGSKSSCFLVSPLNTCSFSLSCSPNSSVAFSGFLSTNRDLIFC
ncbi:hypothetical protein V8G54_009520 [Vigna mungo]|uniref:Uncharacterized protein n=1 Tax=Vigna mungo TaxID=3915 RepID=A0AAQ3NY75_VIGMU